MKFLNTDVWRLNAPVFLSAHPKMPLASLALSAADEVAIVVAKVLVGGVDVGMSCEFSRLSRAADLSMGYVYDGLIICMQKPQNDTTYSCDAVMLGAT